MSILYLKIAGFYLKLEFTEIEASKRKQFLIDLINERYQGFISQEVPRKIDFKITFVFEEKLKSLTSENNSLLFIKIYSFKSKSHLETYYHISLYHLDLILTHVLQKLLSENSGYFIHTSAVIVNNFAFLFLGKSGQGKSTASQLLKDYFPILSDDGAILKKEQMNWYIYQTPFYEKNKTMKKSPEKFPLGKVFFLNKDNEVSVKKLKDKTQIAEKLIAQIYSQHEDINIQFENLIRFINSSDIFYRLNFNKDSLKLKQNIADV